MKIYVKHLTSIPVKDESVATEFAWIYGIVWKLGEERWHLAVF